MAQTKHPGMNPRRRGTMTIADKATWDRVQQKAKYFDYLDSLAERGFWDTEMESISIAWANIVEMIEKSTEKGLIDGIMNTLSYMQGTISGRIQTEEQIKEQQILDAIERRRAKRLAEDIAEFPGESSLEGVVRVAWKDNAFRLLLINRAMIDQWMYGVYNFRCSVLCTNDYFAPYTDCSICDTGMEAPQTIEDEVREEFEPKDEDEDEVEEKDTSDVKEALVVYDRVEKGIKKRKASSGYRGSFSMDGILEEKRKRRINSYLNFMSVMKFTGRKGRMVKGWRDNEFAFWAEFRIDNEWFIFDLKSKFKLKNYLNRGFQKKIRKKYLKMGQLTLI